MLFGLIKVRLAKSEVNKTFLNSTYFYNPMVTKKNVDNIQGTLEKTEKSEVIEVPVGRYFKNLRTNPWIASTVVLGVVLVLVLIFGTGGASGGAKISSDEAGQKVLEFLNSNPSVTGEIELVSAEQDGQFYQVMLTYQGQQVPVYTTLDGEFLVGNPVSLSGVEDTTATDTTATDTTDNSGGVQADTSVPKSDKPKVELFIMSYCPYGTQIEKGILPVATLLGDKIDFEIKFVSYAMHGEKEVTENLRQYCIETEQGDKFLGYLKCFLDASDSAACLKTSGVNTVKMDACTKKTDTQYNIMKNFNDQSTWLSGQYPPFNINKAENEQYGVQGSPTLIVNGKQANSGRDPASLLATVCAAFNTSPEECTTQLSSASPSPGFGWTTTSADSAAAAQCV